MSKIDILINNCTLMNEKHNVRFNTLHANEFRHFLKMANRVQRKASAIRCRLLLSLQNTTTENDKLPQYLFLKLGIKTGK